VGPLRRKILKDAIAFYERIPLQSGMSTEVRFRVAETWNHIGNSSYVLDEYEQSRHAYDKAVATIEPLVAEKPGQAKYRAALANLQRDTGYWYLRNSPKSGEGETLYAELADDHPTEKAWLIEQAISLRYLSEALSNIGKREEAIGCAKRALDVLELSQQASGFDRAQILMQLVWLSSTTTERDSLCRRTIAEYRNYLSADKNPGRRRTNFASDLRAIAGEFASRHPDEAETLLDESITVWREFCGPSPTCRDDLSYFIVSLLEQARHQRRRAAGQAGDEDPAKVAGRLAKAETLFREAIARQRQSVTRFALPADRSLLVQMLREESEYLLGQISRGAPNPEDDSARRLQADALLTEAIQIGRQLVAEFPEDSTHGERLAKLLRIQAQHFGPKEGA
jgi:tetratricopeptide (TPR) repeat protein